MFKSSFDDLNKTNRWVILGDKVPWAEVEKTYNSRLGNKYKGAGYVMMANSNSNKAQGYNRGKKSNVSSGNKNSPHANQKRKEVNRQKYEQLKERTKQLHSKTSKTKEEVAEYNKAKKQLKHLQRIKDNKGENHSRNQKGNR